MRKGSIMRMIKLIMLSIAIFGTLIYFMSLLFPSELRISRAINIGASKKEVHQKISDFSGWNQWNTMAMDLNSASYSFTDSSVTSNSIKASLVYSSNDSIRIVWKSNQHRSLSTFNLIQITTDTTTVQWFFDIELKWYPWDKFRSLLAESQIGPPMENALVKLKKMVEKN